MTDGRPAVSRAEELDLGDDVIAEMHARLPLVAERTVAAVVAEVPGYGALGESEAGPGPDRATLEQGVEMALRGFLNLASGRRESDPSAPMAPALEAAYTLGRGEARSGRAMDALLAAYRIGARAAWRELAGAAVERGLDARTFVPFAELVFAYIDELSAASLVGHSDQLATTGRVRERYRERLGDALVAGAPPEALIAAATRADWEPPEFLVAVILPEAKVRGVLTRVGPRVLRPSDDLPGLNTDDEAAVLLFPASGVGERAQLLTSLRGVPAVVGNTAPWMQVSRSYQRAVSARALGLGRPDGQPLDTDAVLPEIVVGADLDALEDLRARALVPLRNLRPDAAERLTATLRAWLLHSGRRDDVAADLVVHPQTVRYRMGQIRELYGERFNDPRVILELTIALV